MARAVLISLNKIFLDGILDGIKRVEWRKEALPLCKHYGYETKNKGGLGQVTGEFNVVSSQKVFIDNISDELIKLGCVSYDFLVEYANGAKYLFANFVEGAKRFDIPKSIFDFKKPGYKTEERWLFDLYPNTHCHCEAWAKRFELKRPPISWYFVEELI